MITFRANIFATIEVPITAAAAIQHEDPIIMTFDGQGRAFILRQFIRESLDLRLVNSEEFLE